MAQDILQNQDDYVIPCDLKRKLLARGKLSVSKAGASLKDFFSQRLLVTFKNSAAKERRLGSLFSGNKHYVPLSWVKLISELEIRTELETHKRTFQRLLKSRS
jgi:hypothetical protein